LAAALALVGGQASADPVCDQFWAAVTDLSEEAPQFAGRLAGKDGDWCLVEDFVFETPGDYVPDWHAKRVRLRGGALPWLSALIASGSVGGSGGGLVPDRLEIDVEGMRLVVSTGNPQMDYLFAAQARANLIDGALRLSWDAAARVLKLESLTVDFPGDNALSLNAVARGVDLGSTGAMQMSVTSFAVTEADLSVTTHGLFEWYGLMAMGPVFLPNEGDMEAAVAGLKAEATAGIAALPDATFPAATRAAMTAFLAELPNPAGVLTVALRSDPGFGPARLSGYAVNGIPDSLAGAAPLLDGVTVNIGWTHEDTP
jgi:hypothetical protein